MTQMRWTDPRGLRAQTSRTSERDGVAAIEARATRALTGAHPVSEAGAVGQGAASQVATQLSEILGRVRERQVVADERLVDLAWNCFAAGFAASNASFSAEAATQDVAIAPDARGDSPGASLAHLVSELSPRRFEVLQLVAKGLTNREIAQTLGIATNTVKAHVAGVLEALDLTNRIEAAVALREWENESGGSPRD